MSWNKVPVTEAVKLSIAWRLQGQEHPALCVLTMSISSCIGETL